MGVREVCVKKVEKEEVGLDLIEVKFKVSVYVHVCLSDLYVCIRMVVCMYV